MKISNLANLVARSFFIYVIAFLWASYYLHGFFTILLVSTLVTISVNYVIKLAMSKSKKNYIQTKKQTEHMRGVTLQLKFMTRAQTLSLFKIALTEKYTATVNQKKLSLKCTPIQNQNSDFYKNPPLPQAIEIFSLFHKEPTQSDIIECIKSKSENTKALICAESFSPQIILFVQSLKTNVTLLDAAQVYNQILSPSETFPQTKIELQKNAKLTLAQLKTIVFARERTKSYIITAIIIMLTSLVIRLSLYYIIIATIVFALALSSYFSPMQNKNMFE